jgi:hypothetical protein
MGQRDQRVDTARQRGFVELAVHMASACRDVDLIRLDPIWLNPLATNSNQRAIGDELRWTGLQVLRPSSSAPMRIRRMWAHRAVQRDHPDAWARFFVLRKRLLRVKQLGASRRMPTFVGW